MRDLRHGVMIFGVEYVMMGEPSDARLLRVRDGLTVAHYGKAWDPHQVLQDATHDARVYTGRVRPGLTLQRLVVEVMVLCLLLGSPAFAIDRHFDVGPPTDKVGPIISADPPLRETDPPTWAWWAEWVGYVYGGPYMTEQECRRQRFPVYVRCVGRRF